MFQVTDLGTGLFGQQHEHEKLQRWDRKQNPFHFLE